MLPPPLLGIEEGGRRVTLEIDGNNCDFNMKATELRLGLPGSLSPEREHDELDEKHLFPLLPSDQGICNKGIFSGSKRGYSDVMGGNWMFSATNSKTEVQPLLAPKLDAKSSVYVSQKTTMDAASKEKTVIENGTVAHQITASRKDSDNNSPATKALVVGWPPIRSFRKSSLSTNSKNNDEVDGKPGHGALLVKVSMDGAPYLRKVDLRNYSSYQELSSALEKLFSCFSLSQYGCHGGLERGSLSVSKLKDLMHGSEYVLTYEDKDSDWMLVGDVPWEMFIDACRKMKIMKSSDAIGLAAPGAEEH